MHFKSAPQGAGEGPGMGSAGRGAETGEAQIGQVFAWLLLLSICLFPQGIQNCD